MLWPGACTSVPIRVTRRQIAAGADVKLLSDHDYAGLGLPLQVRHQRFQVGQIPVPQNAVDRVFQLTQRSG
jgi:hypothetical protein